ncbi:hypothetical protein BKA69DRAFT_1036067 [Paraphysoderma sedebokerense]|nr:hypothetical protein BKA69DRAFT_1036067 [Paraphysoderma sedebokerense]
MSLISHFAIQNLGLGLFESRPLPSQSGDPNLFIPSGKSVATKSSRNCKIQDISSTTNSALSDSASNLNSKWNESLDQNVAMESQKEKNYNEHGENLNALDFPTENISLESVIHNFLLDVQGRSGDIQTRDLNGLVQNGVRVDDSLGLGLGLGLGCGLEGQRYESSDSDSDNGGSDSDEDMDEDSSSDGTSSDEGSTSSDEEETGKVGDNMDVDLIDR